MVPERRRRTNFDIVPLAEIGHLIAASESQASAHKPPRKRILSISHSPSVMLTREMVLKQQGYEVCSTANLQEALRWCAEGDFDLIIIGHSLPADRRAEAVSQVRKTCSANVLALRVAGAARGPGRRESCLRRSRRAGAGGEESVA